MKIERDREREDGNRERQREREDGNRERERGRMKIERGRSRYLRKSNFLSPPSFVCFPSKRLS